MKIADFPKKSSIDGRFSYASHVWWHGPSGLRGSLVAQPGITNLSTEKVERPDIEYGQPTQANWKRGCGSTHANWKQKKSGTKNVFVWFFRLSSHGDGVSEACARFVLFEKNTFLCQKSVFSSAIFAGSTELLAGGSPNCFFNNSTIICVHLKKRFRATKVFFLFWDPTMSLYAQVELTRRGH